MNVLSTGSRRALRALAIAAVVVPGLAAGTGAHATARDVVADAPGAAAAGIAGFTPTVTAEAARAAQATSGLRVSTEAGRATCPLGHAHTAAHPAGPDPGDVCGGSHPSLPRLARRAVPRRSAAAGH